MIQFVSKKITDYLISKQVINSEDNYTVELYKYGAEITVSTILNLLIVLLLSLILGCMAEGIMFLVIFVFVRQYTGGYHADTYLKCNITLGVSYFALISVYKYVINYIPIWLQAVCLIIEIVFVLIYCPIENENKPITSEKQYNKCKYISVISYVIWGITGMFICCYHTFGNIVFLTLALITIMCIAALIKERRTKK